MKLRRFSNETISVAGRTAYRLLITIADDMPKFTVYGTTGEGKVPPFVRASVHGLASNGRGWSAR